MMEETVVTQTETTTTAMNASAKNASLVITRTAKIILPANPGTLETVSVTEAIIMPTATMMEETVACKTQTALIVTPLPEAQSLASVLRQDNSGASIHQVQVIFSSKV